LAINQNIFPFKKIGTKNMDWTDLPQDKTQYRALVNKVMDLKVQNKE
jgi:hypothetical protein